MSKLKEIATRQHQHPEPIRNGRKRLGSERTLGALREPAERDCALVNTAAGFASPGDVVRDPTLTAAEKQDVLRRWALDEYLIQTGMTDWTAQSVPSRLDEIIDALIDSDVGAKMTTISRVTQARTTTTRFAERAA
jgi:hypothetical protein